MSEIAPIRRRLALTELRARLLERGLDPTYVRGLLADSAIVEKLSISDNGEPTADIAVVVGEFVTALPKNAYRLPLTEDFSDWAERVTTDGPLKKYLEKYVRPSELRKAASNG